MKLMRNTSAFTLVEIMIVLAIIVLLASIAVPNFAQARINSRRNVCINNLRLISAAKEQAGLANSLEETSTPTADQLTPYLKSGAIPNEPISGASSSYTINAISVNPACANSAVPNSHVLPN